MIPTFKHSRRNLLAKLGCMREMSDLLRNKIDYLREDRFYCCSSSSSSSSSSSNSSSYSSSSSSHCSFPLQDIYDEWKWFTGVSTGSGLGVDTWTGINGKVLTTLAGRPDARRSRVESGSILSNGAEGFKTAYQAQLPNDWYSGSDVPLGHCLFFVVEIDLFKTGETTLWNHLLSGATAGTYNSFSSQTSTNSIGTRTNGTYFSIERPAWIQNGVQRYIVELRYGDDSSLMSNDFNLLLNGYPIITTVSTGTLKDILGVGIVAPTDFSANSTLDRRLLSILALKNEAGSTTRLSASSINAARNYLACFWNVELQN